MAWHGIAQRRTHARAAVHNIDCVCWLLVRCSLIVEPQGVESDLAVLQVSSSASHLATNIVLFQLQANLDPIVQRRNDSMSAAQSHRWCLIAAQIIVLLWTCVERTAS